MSKGIEDIYYWLKEKNPKEAEEWLENEIRWYFKDVYKKIKVNQK